MTSIRTMAAALALSLATFSASAVDCVGGIPPSNPDAAYVDNGDGTVTDSRNGLHWKRCAEGQSWNGTSAACDGGNSFLQWDDALQLAVASADAGHDDWRLPNIKELRTLIEACRYDPSINNTVFPDTAFAASESYAFWSASPTGIDAAWFVRTGRGDIGAGPRNVVRMVRLVRGG